MCCKIGRDEWMNKWMQLGTPESSDWGKGFRIIIFWMIHLWVLLDSKQQMLVALSMAKIDQKPCSVGRSSGELGCGQPLSHRRRGGREVVTCDVLHHMFQNNVTWRTFHDDPLRIESWNNEVGRTPQMTECWVLWLFYKQPPLLFYKPIRHSYWFHSYCIYSCLCREWLGKDTITFCHVGEKG